MGLRIYIELWTIPWKEATRLTRRRGAEESEKKMKKCFVVMHESKEVAVFENS